MIKFENFEKENKRVSVSDKKVSAQIPKLDLGFGSRYQNLVSIAH